jgi:hypothetical protein
MRPGRRSADAFAFVCGTGKKAEKLTDGKES